MVKSGIQLCQVKQETKKLSVVATAGSTIFLITTLLSPLNRRPVRLYLHLSRDPQVNTLHYATPAVVCPLNFMPADAEHVPFAHLVSSSHLTLVVWSDQSCCCDIQA